MLAKYLSSIVTLKKVVMGKEEKNKTEEAEQTNTEASINGEEQASAPGGDTKAADFETKFNEVNDKYLRLYSEFDNYRKRTAKEKIDWIRTAGEDIFKNLLPVIDDFERAIKSNASITDIEVAREGFNLIYNKFKNTLQQKGLEEMKTTGTEFNPDMHEAITNVPAPSEEMKGKVIEEVEKGYLLNGKIIRYAKVITGN